MTAIGLGIGLAFQQGGGGSGGGSVFTDDFNRSNENLEASSDWTRAGGAAGYGTVSSNQASSNTTNTSGAAFLCPDQGSGNKYVQADTSAEGGFFPVALRVTDNNNFIGARVTGGDLQLYKRDTGSFTLLGNAAVTVGSLVRIEMVGNDFEVFYGGVSKITATDSFNSAASGIGLIARSTVASMCDNFEAGAL